MVIWLPSCFCRQCCFVYSYTGVILTGRLACDPVLLNTCFFLLCDHTTGLRAFWSLFNFERNFLPFVQSFESVALDCRKMNKNVVSAVILREKAESFRFVEPLDRTCCHDLKPLKIDLLCGFGAHAKS